MFDARSASSRMTVSGSRERGRHVGHLAQEVGEADHRGERIVEVVGDAGDELADGRHFFRLDELVLQSPPLGLIVEQEHEGGPVGAGNRHGGNGIGPLAGAQLHLAARSLLVQGPSGDRRPTRAARRPARAGRSGSPAGR